MGMNVATLMANKPTANPLENIKPASGFAYMSFLDVGKVSFWTGVTPLAFLSSRKGRVTFFITNHLCAPSQTSNPPSTDNDERIKESRPVPVFRGGHQIRQSPILGSSFGNL
jgi:hypothetical protein